MHRTLIYTLLIFTGLWTFAQDEDPRYRQYIDEFGAVAPLSVAEQLQLQNMPELTMNKDLLRDELPAVVDNSELPYLRPVFAQVGPSCGQAASVGYNFTYAMNHARGTAADTSINQYATHFTWNFMNGGYAWFGVSFFHSFEVLRTCGNPNVNDYGGYFHDDGRRWMTGYDLYYNSMQNRIKEAYQIRTDTEAGILTLKHWLYNMMGAAETGGIGSFYANVPYNTMLLPDSTPEAGKQVITAWYPIPSHAMNIVGYNDSIRWDYNEDGQFTNHIDINGDGKVDPKDWEIGGVKCVNSHGVNSCDSGFYYMMYKVLAEDYMNGAIWNNAVNVLDVDPEYTPMLTLKIRMKHDYRQAIRVRAGVSADTTAPLPGHTMWFPIFNFQGGDHYMQGNDTAEYLKIIEFGLDVTPLLGFVESGEPARFFLLIDEDDPYAQGTGEVISCSLMSYPGATEHPFPGMPAGIRQNGLATYSLIHAPVFDEINIVNDDLPPFEEGVPYNQQFAATNGEAPYDWTLVQDYLQLEGPDTPPAANQVRLIPNAELDTIVPVPLDFSFPFYGKTHDTVFVHVDGFIQFDDEVIPWPYNRDPELLLMDTRMIGVFVQRDFIISSEDDGVWYEGDSTSASFRWRVTMGPYPPLSPLEETFVFSATIYPDGRVNVFHEQVDHPLHQRPTSGISAGDMINHSLLALTHPVTPGNHAEFRPCPFPEGLSISPEGLLQGIPSDASRIYDLRVRVRDERRISTERTYVFSNGLQVYFDVQGGGDEKIEYGETVTLDVTLKNTAEISLHDLQVQLAIDDPHITLTDSAWSAGTLDPGMEITMADALTFQVSNDIPDEHILIFGTTITATEQAWSKDLILRAYAPLLTISDVEVLDNDGLLEPGETADLAIRVQNLGHANAFQVQAGLSSPEPGITINGNPLQTFGDILMGGEAEAVYNLSAGGSMLFGTWADFGLDITADLGISTAETFDLPIGKIPVLVIDMDPNQHSGPVIFETLQEMEVLSETDITIPSNIGDYQCLFICLGVPYSHHELSFFEGEVLAEYLDAGGKIYLEGRTAWRDDPWTPVLPKFMIEQEGDPTIFDTLRGVTGTFTEALEFANTATYPFNFHWLVPVGTAYPILEGSADSLTCAVAYENEVYKTIGNMFEFGAMADGEDPSTKVELMQRYLDFFGIRQTIVGIVQQPETTLGARAYPNPGHGTLHFNVDLEEPAILQISILNLQGQCIGTEEHQGHQGRNTFRWAGSGSLESLPAGIYIYTINCGNAFYSGKIIVL